MGHSVGIHVDHNLDPVLMLRFMASRTGSGQMTRTTTGIEQFQAASAVTMPMMEVRIVRVFVAHRLMPVPVRMWFGHRPIV